MDGGVGVICQEEVSTWAKKLDSSEKLWTKATPGVRCKATIPDAVK